MQQNLPNQSGQSGHIPFAQNINLRHYWHTVLERRWLVLPAFFTILALAALSLVRSTPICSASDRIQIDRENSSPLNVRESLSLETREQDYLQTQYKTIVIRSSDQSVV